MSTITSDTRFLNKTIVITGAGGNFGRHGCLYFLRRGARVAALDNNATALSDTVAEVVAEVQSELSWGKEVVAKNIKAFECDVTNVSSVTAAISAAAEFLDGGIDLLWNNAGYQGVIAPTLEYPPADFAVVMNVNVTGMFAVLQAVAKVMAAEGDKNPERKERGFSIVNTASVAGLRGTPAMVAYASSKAAVLAMTVSTAKDLAPYGIRVNAVSPALIGPGYMWTRQNELHAASGSPYFPKDPEEVGK